MIMRKWLYILLVLGIWSCVGQKDDPEPDPEPPVPEVPGGKTEGTRFFRRVLALEFTGTWCQYCPNMTEALEEAQQFRPWRLVEVAMHAYDDYSPACADELITRFNVSGYPTMVLDMDAGTAFNTQTSSIMTGYVDKVVEQNACGLALSCVDGVLTAKIKTVEEGDYALGVTVVEDGLIAYQTGYGADYVNNAVLRRYLSQVGGDGLGALKADTEVTRTYEAKLGEKERVVAYVIKGGKCINALSCKDKETIPYTYEEDD